MRRIAIIGVMLVIVAVVAAGVLAWAAWKQHQRQEEQRREQDKHQRLAQREEARKLENLNQQRLAQREEARKLENLNQPQPKNQETTIQSPPLRSLIGETEDGMRDLKPSINEFFAKPATPQSKPTLASKLADLLASRRWKEADEETLRIRLQVAGREKEGWLDVASIEKFPYEDLRAIDQLWLKSSDGRFGYSVQKQIWKSVGGNLNASDQIYEPFSDRVGWRVNKNCLQVDDLTFNSSALDGHLPAVAIRLGGLSWGVTGFWWEKRQAYVFLLSDKDR
ncbi:GUN4 domain-containing protein [Coleofasciculus sp. H7-2]|uniref:GUN4 domain-containing protein n=1 Tax=Coleofasciculus sp. H7-2 TaxID=3351545 RepID=UPI00366B52C2